MIKSCVFILISIPLYLISVAQTHKLTDTEKENYLYAIWHKDVRHFYVGDSLTGQLILTLVVPDSEMTNIAKDTSGYAFGFAAVYNAFILKPRKIRQDSATVVIYKQSDTLKPFYAAVVHFNLIRYNERTDMAMSQTLMFLCPGAKYCYVAEDELCEVFETSKKLDSTYMMKYATIVTGITAKYFWKNNLKLERIVFVWLDNNGMPYPIWFSIRSKQFSKVLRFL